MQLKEWQKEVDKKLEAITEILGSDLNTKVTENFDYAELKKELTSLKTKITKTENKLNKLIEKLKG